MNGCKGMSYFRHGWNVVLCSITDTDLIGTGPFFWIGDFFTGSGCDQSASSYYWAGSKESTQTLLCACRPSRCSCSRWTCTACSRLTTSSPVSSACPPRCVWTSATGKKSRQLPYSRLARFQNCIGVSGNNRRSMCAFIGLNISFLRQSVADI